MRLSIFFITLCSLLLISCPDSSKNSSNKKKIYWHSENGAATDVDPIGSATFYANDIVVSVYDTLFEYKYLKRGPYELKPNLADSMPQVSEDGLTYTIKIKKGVMFIDDPCFKDGKGREVTAEDFVYSLKRHFDPKNSSQGSWLWKDRIVGLDSWEEEQKNAQKEDENLATDYDTTIDGLKSLDKYTIQIKLTKAYPQILYTLAMGFAAVVPKEAVLHYGKDLSSHPVGSGPFILKVFDQTQAVMVRNEGFREEHFDIYAEGYEEEKHGFTGIKELHGKRVPIVDAIKYSFMDQTVDRWLSLTKGNEIQYATVPPEMSKEILQTTGEGENKKIKQPLALIPSLQKDFHFHHETEISFVMNLFNMTDPEIGYNKDPKRNKMNAALRKAITKAFNWRERIDVFYHGIGDPFVGIIPPGISGYTEFPKEYIECDPEGAKKLLADAGWTPENLPNIVYPATPGVQSRQFYQQFRGWLLAIGYPKEKIEFKAFSSFGALSQAMKERKNMMNPYAWSLDYPDAENVMQLFFGENVSPGSNASNFDNKRFNELFEKAKPMSPDNPERTKIYKEMTQILLDENVGIFGFARATLKVWNKKAVVFPTREILHGYFKYVDVRD